MTVDQDTQVGDETVHSAARPAATATRFVVFALATVIVFGASTWVGQIVRNHHYAALRPLVIAQCKAVPAEQLASKRGGNFTRIDIGPTTTVRRSDGSWAVIETATLSGHEEHGVADGDVVAAKKTCTFSEAAAGHPGVKPGVVRLSFDGPRGKSFEQFQLTDKGWYTGGGSGVEISS